MVQYSISSTLIFHVNNSHSITYLIAHPKKDNSIIYPPVFPDLYTLLSSEEHERLYYFGNQTVSTPNDFHCTFTYTMGYTV